MIKNNRRVWDWAILFFSFVFFAWYARYQIIYALGNAYQLLLLMME
jgi:hypothetical protein